jgi:2-aminoadipate transaminase
MKTALSALGLRTAPPPISWLMKTALARPGLISLAAGFTDNATLPLQISRQLLGDILRSPRTGRPALQYGPTAGESRLRELTASHLQKLDGGHDRAHAPERIIVTGGSQQFLYMTLEALCDEGDIVLVEDPTYFVFLSILQSRGLKARGVRLERDGIDPGHLEKVLERLKRSGDIRRVKALYLVTYFQNPTGVTTSLARKREALKLLKRYERFAGHPLYLLEDAAYRELRFDHGPDVPTALTLPGAKDRVIYAGTYSKPFATGVRVGFGILPEPVYTAVLRIKGNHDFGTANLLQHLLAQALAQGRYDMQVAKVRATYARKARVMKRALAENFPAKVEIWEAGGGLYFWARLPQGIATGLKSKVFRAALKNDVLYVPGELCYSEDPTRVRPNHEMRLSFGSASPKNIHEGVKRLGRVLKKLM